MNSLRYFKTTLFQAAAIVLLIAACGKDHSNQVQNEEIAQNRVADISGASITWTKYKPCNMSIYEGFGFSPADSIHVKVEGRDIYVTYQNYWSWGGTDTIIPSLHPHGDTLVVLATFIYPYEYGDNGTCGYSEYIKIEGVTAGTCVLDLQIAGKRFDYGMWNEYDTVSIKHETIKIQ